MEKSITKIIGVPISISRSGQSALIKFRNCEMKEAGYTMPVKNASTDPLWGVYILLIQGTDTTIH